MKQILTSVIQAQDKTYNVFKQVEGNAGRAGKKINSSFSSSAKSVLSLNKAVLGLGVSLAGVASSAAVAGTALKKSINVRREFEDLGVRLDVINRNISVTNTEMERLSRFSDETPFLLPSVADAAIKLKAMGGEAFASQKNLEMVGNVAVVAGEDINRMAYWFGRAFSLMKNNMPLGEVQRRLGEIGFASAYVTKKLQDMNKAGAGANEMWEVFTTQFDRVNGAMYMLSQTLSGRLSTLQQYIDNVFREFADQGLFESIKDEVEGLIVVFKDLRNSKDLQEWGEIASSVFKSVAEEAKNIGSAAKAVGDIFKTGGSTGFMATIGDLSKIGLAFGLSKTKRSAAEANAGTMVIRGLWDFITDTSGRAPDGRAWKYYWSDQLRLMKDGFEIAKGTHITPKRREFMLTPDQQGMIDAGRQKEIDAYVNSVVAVYEKVPLEKMREVNAELDPVFNPELTLLSESIRLRQQEIDLIIKKLGLLDQEYAVKPDSDPSMLGMDQYTSEDVQAAFQQYWDNLSVTQKARDLDRQGVFDLADAYSRMAGVLGRKSKVAAVAISAAQIGVQIAKALANQGEFASTGMPQYALAAKMHWASAAQYAIEAGSGAMSGRGQTSDQANPFDPLGTPEDSRTTTVFVNNVFDQDGWNTTVSNTAVESVVENYESDGIIKRTLSGVN